MWSRNLSRSERSIRILLAFILIGFSYQGQTSVLQAMAGYLLAGVLLIHCLVQPMHRLETLGVGLTQLAKTREQHGRAHSHSADFLSGAYLCSPVQPAPRPIFHRTRGTSLPRETVCDTSPWPELRAIAARGGFFTWPGAMDAVRYSR